MNLLKVKIVKYISDHQPGFVECIFYDASNNMHVVHEKVPVVTLEELDANSAYPKTGFIACEIIEFSLNDNDKRTIKIDTSRPWGVETVEGFTEFNVFPEQILMDN